MSENSLIERMWKALNTPITAEELAAFESSGHGRDEPDPTGARLAEARRKAKERYAAIATALKAEAGIIRHYKFNQIGGLAWPGTGRILAPEGMTRRQLYVLAHECGHNVLHGGHRARSKPAHVEEHEAETYAHRAFARYGLEVPESSARWSRGYVRKMIMIDRAAGLPICPKAEEFAEGLRSPHDPLPAVDGQPEKDFSKQLARFVAKGRRVAERQELEQPTVLEPVRETVHVIQAATITVPATLPNSCATCWFFKAHLYRRNWEDGYCKGFASNAHYTRYHGDCKHGAAWKPHPRLMEQYTYRHDPNRPRGFWARLGDAIIARIGGK